jgi:hypothetical protein
MCAVVSVQCFLPYRLVEQNDDGGTRHRQITVDHDARRADPRGSFLLPRVTDCILCCLCLQIAVHNLLYRLILGARIPMNSPRLLL